MRPGFAVVAQLVDGGGKQCPKGELPAHFVQRAVDDGHQNQQENDAKPGVYAVSHAIPRVSTILAQV